MPTYTQYKDATDTTVGPSPIIWADCPTLEMMHDPSVGIHHFDNFLVSNIENGDGYQGLGDNVPVYVVDTLNGRVAITSGGTNNDQSMLGTSVDLAHISDAAGEAAKLWFECRVKVSSIADMGIFVGLAAEADMVADFLADDTAELVATADCIGFKVLTASPTAVGTVYQKGSETRADVETGVHTLVADTYVKLGLVYDPAEEDSKKIRFYVNGAETATSVTATNIAAATFPDSVNMGLLATTKTGEGVTKTLTLDWWRVAQLLPRE
tara:strand:+ start:51 stop:851 length:801 start_codon:yes stop_codon:yes gene_type:complete